MCLFLRSNVTFDREERMHIGDLLKYVEIIATFCALRFVLITFIALWHLRYSTKNYLRPD